MLRIGLAAGLLVLLTAPCLAASVESIQGPVSINRGQGFQGLSASSPANPGDQVMASEGGSANIVYPDGCVVKVEPGTVVTVQEASPCNAGGRVGRKGYIIGAVIIGGIAAGVAVLAGGGGGDDEGGKKKADDDDDDDDPASP